jgi:hypothetical protein
VPEAEARIVYTLRPDTTPETERDVLAAVIRFVLDCHAKASGPAMTAPDDASKGSKDERAERMLHRRP